MVILTAVKQDILSLSLFLHKTWSANTYSGINKSLKPSRELSLR